jgi:PPIC-type PPIASE domain
VPRRGRDEALSLATSLYERARAAPLEFAELAAQHSEHLDAVHGGDFGAWSTREPDAYSRELELLLELPVYGVAPPIDTLFGIEVVQRTPDRPRERFAMEMIRLPFDADAAPSEPTSKPAVLELAMGLARQLSSEPQRFAALQAKYCCAGQMMKWTARQEPTLLAYAAERLSLSEIAAQPIEFASTYAIPRRVDPELMPPERPRVFQLPAPTDIDLDTVASRTRREVMQEQLGKIAVQVEQALALDAARSAELRSASQLPAEFSDEATGEQRRAAFRALLARVRVPLGAEGYSRYLEMSRAHLRAWVLQQPL